MKTDNVVGVTDDVGGGWGWDEYWTCFTEGWTVFADLWELTLKMFKRGRCWLRTDVGSYFVRTSEGLKWVPTFLSSNLPSLTSSWIQRYLSSMYFECLQIPNLEAIDCFCRWWIFLNDNADWGWQNSLNWTPEWNSSWLQVTLLLLESSRRVRFLLKNEQLKLVFCLLTED